VNTGTEFLLRGASVAVPALATMIFAARCQMLVHDAERQAGRDDWRVSFLNLLTIMRIAWRQPGGRHAVIGALVSNGLTLLAVVAWQRSSQPAIGRNVGS
jgi:hypothetical protein